MSIQRQNRPTHNLSAKIDKSQAHPVSATETLPSPHIRINEQIINYDISMNGITKMDVRPVDPTALFLIDSDYEVLTRRKPRILGENGTRAYLKATPCGNKKTNEYDAEKTLQAGKEVLDLVINSITTSNPKHFSFDGEVIRTPVAGYKISDFKSDPLLLASLLIPDDLVLMVPDKDGTYRLMAASVCFPTEWSINEKYGMSFSEMHEPVPGVSKNMGSPVEKMFEYLKPERPVERVNMLVQFGAEPSLIPETGASLYSPPRDLSKRNVGRRIYMKNERQIMHKLPSGAVLFGIKGVIKPFSDLDPPVAKKLADIFESYPLDYTNLYRPIQGRRLKMVCKWLRAKIR